MRTFVRTAPTIWAVVLSALMLGPALGVGYVLTYDMVWVPDLAMRSDFLGLGTALPRAVPSDAVVAALDEVVPGMLLQKPMLLGGLVAGGLGAARLAGRSALTQVVAVSVYLWSPFVVERLWLGQWPILLCWAALPWLVLAGVRYRADGRVGTAIPLLLVIGSLSASAGAMSALILLAVALSRRLWPDLRLLLVVVAANGPWIIAGLLHASTSTTGATSAFALRGEGGLPAPLTALSMGGVWNADVVPGSRETFLPWVSLVILIALAAAGARTAWARLGRRTCLALVAAWLVGWLVAVATWATPGAISWIAEHVPGGGLMRDGARALALCAPLTAVLVAAGAERLATGLHLRTGERLVRVLAGTAVALVPIAFLPDAGWGISGQLRPATYPAEYAAARSVLEQPPPGDLLVLPFTSYRAPAWNHGRRVLDPLPRYLQPDYVVNDQLSVDGRILAGEDPRTPQVLAALRLPGPQARSDALAGLGIGIVARELDVPTSPEYDAEVAGRTLFTGDDLELIALEGPVDMRHTPDWQRLLLVLAWAGYVGVLVAALWNLFQKTWVGKARFTRE